MLFVQNNASLFSPSPLRESMDDKSQESLEGGGSFGGRVGAISFIGAPASTTGVHAAMDLHHRKTLAKPDQAERAAE